MHTYPIPSSITAEHREIHEALAELVHTGGDTGKAAAQVKKLLTGHFEKEEAYALPPLGLLVPLSRGEVTSDMREAAESASVLEARLSEMLREHQAIVGALKELEKAGQREGKPNAGSFAARLMQHAKNEEEVLYPAAILVGKYIKERRQ